MIAAVTPMHDAPLTGPGAWRADVYLAGHDHDIQHLSLPGWSTTFVMVGGGGATTRPIRQDNRGPFSRADNGFGQLEFTPEKATVRLLNRRGELEHEFERDLAGRIRIVHTRPSDVAIPRTPKSITRGGSETPATAPATVPTD